MARESRHGSGRFWRHRSRRRTEKEVQTVESQCNPPGVLFLISVSQLTEYFLILRRRTRNSPHRFDRITMEQTMPEMTGVPLKSDPIGPVMRMSPEFPFLKLLCPSPHLC